MGLEKGRLSCCSIERASCLLAAAEGGSVVHGSLRAMLVPYPSFAGLSTLSSASEEGGPLRVAHHLVTQQKNEEEHGQRSRMLRSWHTCASESLKQHST